jgi:hypothetical protein
MVQYIDRETIGFVVGTVLGTIISAPVNYSLLIYGFRYIAPASATGTVSGVLMNQRLGTVLGTVDVVTINSNSPDVRDQPGETPVSKLEAGQTLVGVVVQPSGATASLQGVMVYAYAPGRVQGGGL